MRFVFVVPEKTGGILVVTGKIFETAIWGISTKREILSLDTLNHSVSSRWLIQEVLQHNTPVV